MPRLVPLRTAILPVLLVGTLAACQQTATVQTFDYGEEQLAACIASACTELTLDYAPLPDYSRIAGLNHVTALMLGFTDFADLGDLATMTQLQELHIGYTHVRDLTGIAAFPDLRLLHIQNVEPQSWEPLASLQNLRELAIGHHEMADLSIIARLPRLERLHIANVSDLTDLSGIGSHGGLQSVHLDNDALSDLSPLLRLPNLRDVSMDAFDETRHAAVIAQLRARGVRVTITEPVVVVC